MSNLGSINDTFNMFGFGTGLPAAAAALSAEDRVSLVNALKDKLHLLSGQKLLESLPFKVRKRVEFLRDLQSEHGELEAEFVGEIALLEAKYQRLYEPLYRKRYEIVNGMVEVEGVTEEVKNKKGKDTQDKGVPDFWLTVMNANEMLAEEITERDKGALKCLQDIKCCRLDNPKGFKLEFYFDTNPYFKNSVLTKTYLLDEDDHDDALLEKAIGTEIKWNPGKCLTQKVLRKKPKNGSKNHKPITKTENCNSFFNFFNPPQIPEDDESLDDDAAEDLQYLMEKDYDIGSTIRDKIIPRAVSWYTGEAVETEHEGTEEDEDEEEDDEEEEEREGKTWKKKSGRAQSRKGQQAERPINCTQQ